MDDAIEQSPKNEAFEHPASHARLHVRPVILLVEDDANDVFLLERAFGRIDLEHRIVRVSDGEEAIQYLTGVALPAADPPPGGLPSVVLLDVKLPRRSGHEVLAWIREAPELRRLPVVMLSSSREESDIDRAYDLGANSYLVKPTGFDALANLVQTFHAYWIRLNERPELRLRPSGS